MIQGGIGWRTLLAKPCWLLQSIEGLRILPKGGFAYHDHPDGHFEACRARHFIARLCSQIVQHKFRKLLVADRSLSKWPDKSRASQPYMQGLVFHRNGCRRCPQHGWCGRYEPLLVSGSPSNPWFGEPSGLLQVPATRDSGRLSMACTYSKY